MRSRYKCRLCGFSSGQKQEVYRHLRREHPGPDTELEMKHFARSNTSYLCSVCDVEEETFPSMLTHMKLNHPDFLVKEKGRKRKAKGNKIDGTKDGAWACGECKYRAKDFNNLKIHTMRIHLTSSFTCQLCTMTFSNRTAAVTHIEKEHRKLFNDRRLGWARMFIKNVCKVSS